MTPFRPLRLLVPFVAIGAALALFLGVGLVAFNAAGGGGTTAYGSCDTSGADGFGGGRVGTTIGDLTHEQRTNAATIIATARDMGAPPRAWLVALATAMQESLLLNLDHGDRDSLGLFQQRPSKGWGTPAQVTDPVHSTTSFVRRLLTVPGWDSMTVTRAAQVVQASAFPDAYRKWEDLATDLVRELGQVTDPAGCGAAAAVLAAPGGAAGTAVAFALGEVGKPYVWGATGPDTYDCSGLMLRAFEAAGIRLPRVSRQQFYAGAHLPVREAQAGDFLFYATDPQDPATIHHVALYLGDGRMVEAPYAGEQVRVRPVPWDYGQLVPLATRPGTPSNRA